MVVWDAGMSGREDQYEEYKAERSPRPDLLREQWPHFEPLVEAFGYQNVQGRGLRGRRRDRHASPSRPSEQGIDVMVVTGDRDMLPAGRDGRARDGHLRGITDTRVYDREGVIERYGIPPELIPDFIGLKGDTSDNIPGVPGIGDKTAAQLLQQYGTLEDGAGARRRDLRRQAQAEPRRARRRRAHLEAARDARCATCRCEHRRRRSSWPSAPGPLAAARGLPRVRAARPAAAARGGARRRARRPRRGQAATRRGCARRGGAVADLGGSPASGALRHARRPSGARGRAVADRPLGSRPTPAATRC